MTSISATTTTVDAPRVPRGLFDALLAAVLIYGVYSSTPWGALVETAVRVGLGQSNRPSLFSTFRGRETTANVDVIVSGGATGALHARPQSLVDAAKQAGFNEDLLAAYMSALGVCSDAACHAPRAPEFESWLGRDVHSETVPVVDVAFSLAAASEHFSSEELAVEAQFLPALVLSRALEQAARSGVENAHSVEAHADFISPALRRGPLQDAIRVIATHRLATLAWPVDVKYRVTSPFGKRIHPVLGTEKFHNGTDVGTPVGTPLLSAHHGKVRRAGRDSVSGLYVIVDHGLGIETAYCHMSEHDVTTDAVVVRSQRLGLSGATGRVTGPHLHYILRVDGGEVDPQLHGAAPRRPSTPTHSSP